MIPRKQPLPRELDFVADRVTRVNACLSPALLSVIVPVFNEQHTVKEILRRVLAVQCDKQVIVVDDCSSDRTLEVLRELQNEKPFYLIRHDHNRGKGAAIRTGLLYATGLFTVIQDADLEYDPQDYLAVLGPLVDHEAQVVYGSRYLNSEHSSGKKWNVFRLGVSVLNFSVRVIYGVRLTDEATCYKAFSTAILRTMDLECERFEFCPEVTAKACRLGLRIHEVPIDYNPRTSAAGKKIRYRDGLSAVWTLWRWRKWLPQAEVVPAVTEGLQLVQQLEPGETPN